MIFVCIYVVLPGGCPSSRQRRGVTDITPEEHKKENAVASRELYFEKRDRASVALNVTRFGHACVGGGP